MYRVSVFLGFLSLCKFHTIWVIINVYVIVEAIMISLGT